MLVYISYYLMLRGLICRAGFAQRLMKMKYGSGSMNEKYEVKLKVRIGCRLSLTTGEIEWGHPDRMSTLHFYHAYPGSRLYLLNKEYAFAIASYSLKRNEKV